MKRSRIIDIIKKNESIQTVCVSGWVRTKRNSKNIAFIAINDGSCQQSLQVIIDGNTEPKNIISELQTGTAVTCVGALQESPQAVKLLNY